MANARKMEDLSKAIVDLLALHRATPPEAMAALQEAMVVAITMYPRGPKRLELVNHLNAFLRDSVLFVGRRGL